MRGKKTDLKDGERIAELLRHGLLSGSFVPSERIRALRELTRYRARLAQRQAAISNRIRKILEEGNIKLAPVASDVLGVSGRAMLRGLVEGERNPEELAALAKGKLRDKTERLAAALEGHLLEHHRFLLERMLEDLEHTEESIRAIERKVEQYAAPFEELAQNGARRETVPGSSGGARRTLCASEEPLLSPIYLRRLDSWRFSDPCLRS